MAKVYFLNNCFPTHNNPAIGTYAKTIADAIEDAGYDLKLIVLYRGNSIAVSYLLQSRRKM